MRVSQPDQTPVLSVTLRSVGPKPIYMVEHIELQGPSLRHRIHTTRVDQRLHAVLAPDLADFLLGSIEKLNGQTSVFSDVDAELRLADLTLGNVQSLSSMRPDGTQKIVIRFVHVEGDVHCILRDAMSTTQAESKAIAVEAIERVVGRTYDVTRVYEQMAGLAEPAPEFKHCTRDILSRREELLFRLNLLQRATARSEAIRVLPPKEAPNIISA